MFFANVTRKQAFLMHLSLSVCIFFVFFYFIVFHWYPEFYFFLDGGVRATVTIFFIDMVLGPGLTLLLFKPGKKGLKFDMVMILLIQSSALVWGIDNVYSERSGAMVYYWGKFSCLSHNNTSEIDMAAVLAGPSGEQRLSFLQRPDTAEEFHDFVSEPFKVGSSEIYYYGGQITALDEQVVSRLINYRLNLSRLAAEDELAAKHVKAYLDHHADDVEHIRLVPLLCRFDMAIAVYDMRQLKITDFIEVERMPESAEAQDEPLRFKAL